MAENTPESELGSIECFQNYTAPEVFIQGLAGIVNQQDVESMIRAQKQMTKQKQWLQRFEKTNEMLSNCNSLSINRLKVANSEFKKHTHLLTDMRKDLDNIFKRINILKSKLNSQYPQAFTAERVQNSSFCKEDKVNTFSNEVNTGKSAPSKSYGLATGINNTENNDNIRFKDSAGTGEQGVEEDDNCFAPHNPDDRKTMKRANSSSSDSNNGNSNNDSSPYTSDTG